VSVPEVVVVPTPGLGNSTYLVASGSEAVVIDVPRDAWRVREVAQERGWRVTKALETHVHNDYLSGARELAAAEGTTIVVPAQGGYAFDHRAAGEGFEVALGDAGLVARATPGHTPEHISWELQDGAGRPRALFSGGSLLIGGVGRTDLLGRARTAELTAAQFRTMRRLAELPDEVVVHPTHGAGSFCVAGDIDIGGLATIGALKRWNPAFAASELEAFDAELAVGRSRYPAYYRRMAPLNRRGPRLLGGPPEPRPMTSHEFAEARAAGAWIVDARDRWAFAESHIKGSWNIEAGDSFAAYAGWLLPFDAPIGLIVDDPRQEVEVAEELLRIGYDHVLGHLAGGLDAWVALGGETGSYATASWEELRSAGGDAGTERILDVRQPYEWRQGVVPGSELVFVADLPGMLPRLDRERRYIVACRTGVRAAIAASLLDAAGIEARPVVDGGIPALGADELEPAADTGTVRQ
jgi:glyoxylase-like metal-dependent hydrolase (beta-lactamase superfamily II)/rhodanese-related sulfurtransferase